MTKRDIMDEEAEAKAKQAADSATRIPVAVALSSAKSLGEGGALASTDTPRVVATGKGAVAEQILELAFAHGVKVRTDPDLAQILSAVEEGSIIPVEAFVAVAEILAYVYRANNMVPPPDLAANWETAP
jgi:flagellar biosynthesis protein